MVLLNFNHPDSQHLIFVGIFETSTSLYHFELSNGRILILVSGKAINFTSSHTLRYGRNASRGVRKILEFYDHPE